MQLQRRFIAQYLRDRDVLQVKVDAILVAVEANRTIIDAMAADDATMATRVDALLTLIAQASEAGGRLVIHGTNKDNMLTTVEVNYLIAGVPKVLAIQTEITTGAAGTIADGNQAWLLLTVNAAGTIAFTKGADHASAAVLPAIPSSQAVFGAVKCVNATGSEWIFGTDNFNEASLTATFFDAPYVTALTALGSIGETALGATGVAAIGAMPPL